MKRLNNYSVMPEVGEIMKFADIYGRNAGEGGSLWRHFGSRYRTKENPVEICIELEPIPHTEHKMLFSAASGMTNALGGYRELIIADHPYANRDDEGVVAVMDYGYKKLNEGLVFFVNDKDERPGGDVFFSKYHPDANGELVMTKATIEEAHWLKPHVPYYLTYRRIGNDIAVGQSRNLPLSLYYVGNDSIEKGAQIALPLEVDSISEDAVAEEISIGGKTGVVIWDE